MIRYSGGRNRRAYVLLNSPDELAALRIGAMIAPPPLIKGSQMTMQTPQQTYLGLVQIAVPLIMLSATPHDGKARSFASLVNMLDATAITNPDDYTREDFRPGLVIRRFKKDVQEQVRDAFKDRQVFPQRFSASAAEEAAYDALLAVRIAGRRPETATRASSGGSGRSRRGRTPRPGDPRSRP